LDSKKGLSRSFISGQYYKSVDNIQIWLKSVKCNHILHEDIQIILSISRRLLDTQNRQRPKKQLTIQRIWHQTDAK
jgi:hypothetical protein